MIARSVRLASACGLFLALFSCIADAAQSYYVAKTGSDANPGTSTLPFLTIGKAAQVMAAGDTCLIESGIYRETVTPARDGTAASPIVYAADSGASVTIAGSVPVDNWRSYSGQIYRAAVPTGLASPQVYQWTSTGFAALIEARWPSISSYDLPSIHAAMATARSGTSTTLTDPALTQPSGYWTGATLWARGGYGWLGQTTTITGFDSSTHTLQIAPFTAAGTGFDPAAGTTYYITNCLNALSSPGEYYYDGANGYLYVWSPQTGAPTNIEISKRPRAFVLNNRSNIQIRGIAIVAADIDLVHATNCVVDSITDKYVAYADTSQGYMPTNQADSGFDIEGDGNAIENSDISYSTGCLISVNGNGNRIVNNRIHEGDYLGSYAPLIWIAGGSDNLISNNTLQDSGRFGIYLSTSNSCIQYNDISDYMWVSSDGGGIYGWGIDLHDTEIGHNIVHGSHTINNSGVGIYLDNYTENAIVHHNVVYDIDGAGLKLNTPQCYELIYNNTVDCSDSVDHWGVAPYADDMFDDSVVNNIFTGTNNAPGTVSSSNNVGASGVDFTSPASGDYTLQPGSTAIDTGVVIPGITTDYIGSAPDCGAYEFGAPAWSAGCNFATRPSPTFVAIDTPRMNRVRNGGFESGLEDWTLTGTKTAKTVSIPSEPAWRERGLQNSLSLGSGVNGVSQIVKGLAPSTTYQFAAWVFVTGAESYTLGVASYGGAPVSVSGTNAQYVHQILAFTTGAKSTTATIYLKKTSAGSGAVIADDLGVIPNN